MNVGGHDFVERPGAAIVVGVGPRPKATGNMDTSAFSQDGEVRHGFALPGGHVDPGGLDGKFSIPVLGDTFRHQRETDDGLLGNLLDMDLSNDALKFNSIDVFHSA